LDYPYLRKAVQEQFIKHSPRLVIFERSHIGHALYAAFDRSRFSEKSREGKIVFTRLSPKKSKEERAAVQAVKIEQGRVFLPVEADWLEIFENEIRDFPVGRYDDQVDSMVQFLMAMDFPIPWVNC